MDDATLLNHWYFALVVAGVVVMAAAALLIAVWMAARRILRLASAALEQVVQIKRHTDSIWALDDTNATAADILNGAESIREHTEKVAHKLHETA